MAQKYAKDEPAGFTNRIERVALVGAGGRLGKHIAQAVLKTGNHTLTALSRPDRTTELPAGIHAVPVDYDDPATLAAALHNQQFLIITLSVRAPRDTHSKLVQAAAAAGVPYVMPNTYGYDITNESLAKDSITGDAMRVHCAEIEATGVSAYIALVCSLWYEYSLVCGPEWFGFDFPAKKLTLYDDGNTRINVSTWEQCGRAVAALVSLKELPEDEGDKVSTLCAWRNRQLEESFWDTDAEWTVESEPSVERYKRGIEMFKTGNMKGFGLAAFSRVFYQNGDGNYEDKYGLANDLLGLPKEDLDERTKIAKGVLDSGYSYLTRS